MFVTEVDFTLPKGYLDADGALHTTGTMRLATAADEILPLKDPRVQQNPGYLTIIVLARVVTSLGTLSDINTKIIEGLYVSDLDKLQHLYERINAVDDLSPAVLDGNGQHDEWDTRSYALGGSMKAYPVDDLYEEMAFIAYHFHWSHEELMQLEHQQRRRWCDEISQINRRLNGTSDNPFAAV